MTRAGRRLTAFAVPCLLSCFGLTGCGGSSSPTPPPAAPAPPSAAAPSIASVTPADVPAGSAAFTLTVNGANYNSTSVIVVDGVKETTTYVSAAQLTATVPASQVASGAQLDVQVLNGSTSSPTSSSNAITVVNPAPVIVSLTPATLDGTFPPAVVVAGTGFVPTSVLELNGSARQTAFLDSTRLSLTLTAADLATPGSDAVTVVNAAPGGGTSPAVALTVSPTPVPPAGPALSLTGVNPNQFTSGSPDTTIRVTGTGFDASAIVNWNGQPLTTTLVGPGFLMATVPAVDFAQVGAAGITVTSTTIKPSPTAAVTVQVVAPGAPQLTSFYPNAGPINTAVTLQLSGTGFGPSSVVQWNGQSVPTIFVSDGVLTANVPAGVATTLGNAAITVMTPAPGGGASQALPFTAYFGITSNSAAYNPVDGLLYLSIPSSAGAPLGNSVVSVDPATGALGQPIFVGSEPNQLTISSDGSTLFVGLDGAGAVRQVDLPSHTAGIQFALGSQGGIYEPPGTAQALAPLPGLPHSVAVSLNNASITGGSIRIYDDGVARTNASTVGYPAYVNTLVADPSQPVLYGLATGAYNTYTYDANGVTPGLSTSLTNYYSTSAAHLQIDNGRAYTDGAAVLDAGTGSLLGTFYFAPNTPASGPFVSDSALGKYFALSNPQGAYQGFTEIQAFHESDFTPIQGASIPVNGSNLNNIVYGAGAANSPLWRWGTQGLVFRTSAGVFSFRTDIVQDLSQTQADLQAAVAVSGAQTAGSTLTFMATVTNHGPQAATDATLTGALPAETGVLSANSTQGYCSTSAVLACNLGTLANGASATVTLVLQPHTAGTLNLSLQAAANEPDPAPANNITASTLAIAGAPSGYEPVPVLTDVSPNGAQVGSTDTTIAVTGSGFSPDSAILWNGTPLPTSVVSTSRLTAVVTAAQLSSFGWAQVAVSSPGGGASSSLPFTIYTIVYLSANHLLYNPYDRLLYATVNSAATQVTGNSIVTIDPLTGTIGQPVNVGSQPSSMALSDDGQALYTTLTGSNQVALFRPLTQTLAFSFAPPTPNNPTGSNQPRGIAVQPGTENTIAIDEGSFEGLGLYDIDPSAQNVTLRGNRLTGPYTGSGPTFLDAGDLLSFDTDTSGSSLDHFLVSSSGLSGVNAFSPYESTLFGFGAFSSTPAFKINAGLAFADGGGVANPATVPATQIGLYKLNSSTTGFFGTTPVEPDTSLGEVFFFGPSNTSSYNPPQGFLRYDEFSFLPTGFLPLSNLSTSVTNSTAVDLVRFGSDGLAFLTSAGQIYLARGPFVVPELLQLNPVPTLSALSITGAAHGSGNLRLTVTGSNLVFGATVQWNGAPRTTTRLDTTHLSVAIPAADLAAAGTAAITVTNPATAASNAATFTIH